MFSLTERNYDYYEWNGVRLELNLAFDNVLLLFNLFDDESVNKHIKPEIALNMLVVEKLALNQLDSMQKAQLITDILKDKLAIDLKALGKQKEQKEEEEEPKIPVVDFTVDAERIYSSFLFDYNIDLIEQQGKMTWNKFIALFNNLSSKSPMGIAIHYRTCKIPQKNEHNADERKHIKKMRDKYELPEAKQIREQQEFIAHQKYMESQKARVKGR